MALNTELLMLTEGCGRLESRGRGLKGEGVKGEVLEGMAVAWVVLLVKGKSILG